MTVYIDETNESVHAQNIRRTRMESGIKNNIMLGKSSRFSPCLSFSIGPDSPLPNTLRKQAAHISSPQYWNPSSSQLER